MNIGKALRYVFDDENWFVKFIVGAFLSWIPLIGLINTGYIIQLIRNVRDGEAHPLPKWNNIGMYFMDGLNLFIGISVYFIPTIAYAFITMLIFFGLAFLGQQERLDLEYAQIGLWATGFCMNCGIFLLGIGPAFLYPAILIRYAKLGKLSSVFNLRSIIRFAKRDLGNYILLILFTAIFLYTLSPLGMIIFVTSLLFTYWVDELVLYAVVSLGIIIFGTCLILIRWICELIIANMIGQLLLHNALLRR